jgi:CheY-like chemotaxis protein
MSTILVVDDEPSIIEVLEIVLLDEGMDVLKSNSGRDALALLREKDVDVVISDIRMPDFSGVELLREAKTISPERRRLKPFSMAPMITSPSPCEWTICAQSFAARSI